MLLSVFSKCFLIVFSHLFFLFLSSVRIACANRDDDDDHDGDDSSRHFCGDCRRMRVIVVIMCPVL